MTVIIGITGKKGSGKDTVAEFINGVCRDQIEQVAFVAFADPVREVCQTALGLTHNQLTRRDLKEEKVRGKLYSPREAMQKVGTDMFRATFGEDIWVNIARDTIMSYYGDYKYIVVTDVRFDNEAQMVKNLGGEIWHVCRDKNPLIDSHISESGIDAKYIDQLVTNDGTLEELKSKVEDLL